MRSIETSRVGAKRQGSDCEHIVLYSMYTQNISSLATVRESLTVPTPLVTLEVAIVGMMVAEQL